MRRDPRLSVTPKSRLAVFVNAGLIKRVPTPWQLFLGQLEMAPYVFLPDDTDRIRYQGTRFGHPLARTPIVLWNVGLDHFRVGSGLGAKPASVYRHLNFVYHHGMPAYDLQLAQTIPNGLEALRLCTEEIERGATKAGRRQRRWIDRVVPNAAEYRHRFLRKGGWIDQAANLDYPRDSQIPTFQRQEFTSLARFANYCATAFPGSPGDVPFSSLPKRLWQLTTRGVRDFLQRKH